MATIKAIEARSVHQIQSGQVIVDLCSVVKELVENSLDAGATSIEVRFKNDGLDSIEVQDNGRGIAPENYESIALKHYTSKLATYDDLTSLTTFGFRGEALSSLCAVSDFHIITAQADQVPKANKLEFERSGKLKGTQIVAGQKGTITSALNLFSNLPVRRRELEKNIKRELAKVVTLLNEYACISTGVRFNVKNTDAKRKAIILLTTKANSAIKENIANVYGAKTLLTLIPLDLDLEYEPSAAGKRLDRELKKIRVRGYVSRPVVGEGRGTRDRQMYFVNSRPCGIPQIARAFNEVYKSYNLSQAPFVLADFQMDTNAYDVNVSPDKRSILLHDSAALTDSLKEALDTLFQEAEQTVPQSQITNAKQQGGIRQHIQKSLVPTVLEAGGDEQQAPLATKNDVAVSHDSAKRHIRPAAEKTTSQAENQDDEIRGIKESVVAPTVQEAPSTTIGKDSSSETPEDDEADKADEAVEDAIKRIRARAAETSPEVNDRRPSRLGRKLSPDKPNVIQNAFDRIRPARPLAEIATITIGDRTVTSVVGRGPTRKRDSSSAGNTDGKRESKRRIHTPSKPNIFSQSMRSFAAPGTLVNASAEEFGSSEESGEDKDIDDAKNGDAKISAASQPTTEAGDVPTNEDDGDSAKSVQVEPLESQRQEEVSNPEDEDYVDETQERSKEEAKVQELIRKAEEKIESHSDNHLKRGKYIEKEQQSQRDSTIQLVATINSSIPIIQEQMDQLQKKLKSHDGRSSAIDEDEKISDETGEERLSLTVSKDDFSKMRVVGQFNLGFVLATRSHEADEVSNLNKDELFIIDQHASDEKYNFEKLQEETVVQSQRLVHPKTLDLTAVEEEVIKENQPALEKNGFVIEVDDSGDEPIGRRCKLISLPLSKEVVFEIRDLEELIVLLSDTPTSTAANVSKTDIYIPRPSKVRKMFAMRACRSSIMIGKTLTVKQMEKVVRNMGTIDKPWNCPHGRPTMRHLMSLGSWNEYDEYSSNHVEVFSAKSSRTAWEKFYHWQAHQGDSEEYR